MTNRNYFRNRMAHLADRMSQLNAIQVIIQRGLSESLPVWATPGKTRIDEAYPGVEIVISEARDYLIYARDYDLGSGPVSPREGDIIREVESGIEAEVLPLGLQAGARSTLTDRTRYRVHTKLIENVQ